MICKNCAHEFEGEFCNACGQKATVDRINFGYVIWQIPNSLFQLNRGFFFTLKALFIRPGDSVREFLEGKRVQHYKPIAFFLLCSTLYVLATYLTSHNTFLEDLIIGFKLRMEEQTNRSSTPILDWIVKYQIYIPLVVLPIYALSSYLVFLRSKYNYFEHLVFNLYITGQQMMIYLLLGFVFFKENIFMAVPFLVGILYNGWAYYQFFKEKPPYLRIILILLIYPIFFLLFNLSLVLLVRLTKLF